ncbi:MAG: hypothetical protein CL685_00575 [Candidatus Magasanikbacteria bacterium]|nr:hypothetical protein [Candidatus Magasanikbacteria bacterium]|tara:strand:+ start:1535 stop:2293 length:759 start_codon:yes stop_codon:yes gene_type:complete
MTHSRTLPRFFIHTIICSIICALFLPFVVKAQKISDLFVEGSYEDSILTDSERIMDEAKTLLASTKDLAYQTEAKLVIEKVKDLLTEAENIILEVLTVDPLNLSQNIDFLKSVEVLNKTLDEITTISASIGPAEKEIAKKLQEPLVDRCKKVEGLLPQCAVDGNCRNLNDYLCIGINISEFILSIIGSIAFVMFLFGGFTMIMSFGNPEKFKKGQGIMIAAVIGICIAIFAHLIIQIVLDTTGVKENVRVIK